jgi:molecular chaperone DnaK
MAMTGDDPTQIRLRSEAVSRAAMRIGEAMQQAGQANTGAAGRGGSAGADAEDVVDAEFEDVDDTKRRTS